MSHAVPFYANSKNNLRCYQAVLRMVLKHFEPDKSYTWKQLDQLTARVKGKGTWPTQGFINFHKMGYKLIFMEDFDYQAFIAKPEQYLINKYGRETAETQIRLSDIPQEVKLAKLYLQLFSPKPSLPTLENIRHLLNEAYLIVCNVNYYPLYNKKGYNGHFVLIYKLDKQFIHLHDPGLPPNPSAKIPLKNFLNAWHYPKADAANLVAYRLK